MIARVLPDLPAVEKEFDYLVPEPLRGQVRVGTIVRVELHGRRVRGWVVALADEAAPGVDPKPLAKVTGAGPPPEVVDLARWAAWRWAGRWVHLLRVASPPAAVPGAVLRCSSTTGGRADARRPAASTGRRSAAARRRRGRVGAGDRRRARRSTWRRGSPAACDADGSAHRLARRGGHARRLGGGASAATPA